MPLEIKNYRDLGDLRRDLALLEGEIEHSIAQVHHYLQVLSNLQVISAINVRGKGVAPELQRVVQPVLPLQDMAKNIAALRALQEQNNLLGHMLLQMQQTFADNPKAPRVTQELVSLRAKVKIEYDHALKMVSDTAQGKVPTKFKKWTTKILAFLQEKFANHYEQDFAPRFLVTMQGENVWHVAYLLFKGLKDDTGFRHDRYFIILTQVVTPEGQEKYHSTISSTLRLPGSYSFDVTANTLDELLQLINDQIAVDRMISRVDPRELTIEPTKIKMGLRHSAIQSTKVEKNVVTVYLQPNVHTNQLAEIRNNLKVQLLGLIRRNNPKNKDIIRDQIVPSNGKKLARISFIFTIPYGWKGKLLNSVEYLKLKDILHLNDDQICAVRIALENQEEE